jgi:hypothetical protein
MRTQTIEWLLTVEVEVGNNIACLLPDAEAYLPVTGWADHRVDLPESSTGFAVERVFTVAGAPEWVAPSMLTFTLLDGDGERGVAQILDRH